MNYETNFMEFIAVHFVNLFIFGNVCPPIKYMGANFEKEKLFLMKNRAICQQRIISSYVFQVIAYIIYVIYIIYNI